MACRNALHAQSGKISAAINSSACGVLQRARRYPDQIVVVYAGHNGFFPRWLLCRTHQFVDSFEQTVATDSRE